MNIKCEWASTNAGCSSLYHVTQKEIPDFKRKIQITPSYRHKYCIYSTSQHIHEIRRERSSSIKVHV